MTDDERRDVRAALRLIKDAMRPDVTFNVAREGMNGAESVLMCLLTACPKCDGTGKIDVNE